jgi:hypothetical protein
VSDEEAARSTLDDGVGSLWCSSSSGDDSGGGGDDRLPFSQQQLGVGGLGSVAR